MFQFHNFFGFMLGHDNLFRTSNKVKRTKRFFVTLCTTYLGSFCLLSYPALLARSSSFRSSISYYQYILLVESPIPSNTPALHPIAKISSLYFIETRNAFLIGKKGGVCGFIVNSGI